MMLSVEPGVGKDKQGSHSFAEKIPFYFLAALGSELGVLRLLGRCSTRPFCSIFLIGSHIFAPAGR
jgi:hypothetical protein